MDGGKLNGLDLFSGIGGITLALQDYVTPIAYCEREPYVVAWLLESIRVGRIPAAPICTDIRELRGDMCRGVDIIYGGFPCQDVSVAGARKGLDGERTGLFWEVVRLTEEIAPPFIFLENVQGISKFIPTIRDAFEKLGYSCRDGFLSAADIGANHKRERWFFVAAHADRLNLREQQRGSSGPHRSSEVLTGDDGETQSLADATGSGREEGTSFARESSFVDCPQGDNGSGFNVRSSHVLHLDCLSRSWWAVEPNVDRVVDGVPFGVDRITALGNAVVPAQAREAFMRLMGMINLSEVIK